MWCKSCSKIVCMHCIATDHIGHIFEVLDKAVQDVKSDIMKKMENFEENYHECSYQLLKKKSEVEETIQQLEKFEKIVQLEKKKFQTILTQIVDQQKKNKERMDNLSSMKVHLNDKTRINRQNMLVEYHEDLGKPEILGTGWYLNETLSYVSEINLKCLNNNEQNL